MRRHFRTSRAFTVLVSALALSGGAGKLRAQDPAWSTVGSNTYCITCNVGVGTSSPGFKLHVVGTGATAVAVRSTTNGYLDSSSIRFGNDVADDQALVFFASTGYTYQGGSQSLNLFLRPAAAMTFSTNAIERMRIVAGGNVGIGTAAPNIYGYSAPSTVLTIKANGASGLGALELAHTYPDAAGNPAGIVIFADPNQSGAEKRVGAIIGVTDGTTVNNRGGYLNFWTKGDGAALQERLRIDRNGNVGIGTASPAAKLDVNGSANFSGTVTGGNIQAKYQDLAEWVPGSGALNAGTVVILDPGRRNAVIPSRSTYDTRVAGVVSAHPGILLGERSAVSAAVATTGRVLVKADATRGPIRVGDLLVTSDCEGYAMKSVPVDVGGVALHRPGTLLGKALEPLDEGYGAILVLLSLQ